MRSQKRSASYYHIVCHYPLFISHLSNVLLLLLSDRSLTISEVNRRGKQVESKENCVASEVIERLSGQALDLTIDHR